MSVDQKLIVLVSVKYDESKKRDFYKLEINNSIWKTIKTRHLKAFIKNKFGTKKFSTVIVRPKKCYVFYAKMDISGAISHFSSTGFNHDEQAQRYAVSREDRGFTVIDIGCNDGVPVKYPEAPFLIISKEASGEKNAPNILLVKDGEFSCSDVATKSYTTTKTNRGSFLFHSSSGSIKVDGARLFEKGGDDKEIVCVFLFEMKEAYKFVCNESGSAAQMSNIRKMKTALITLYRSKYKRCKVENKYDNRVCEHLKKRIIYVGAVRG